jgi:hypothetical protein
MSLDRPARRLGVALLVFLGYADTPEAHSLIGTAGEGRGGA